MGEAHGFHEALPGYDARQILVDGCGACEARARYVPKAIYHMDSDTFAKAWRRAWDLWCSQGNDDVGWVSDAEGEVLETLWAVQFKLQRAGVPLDGTVPNQEGK